MKLSIGSRMTHDSTLGSLDFDVTFLPPCRPPVTIIRRNAVKVAPPAPTHTRSESGAIAPTTVPAWYLVIRTVSGSLHVSQECKAGEAILYQHRDQNAAERFLSAARTSTHHVGKTAPNACDGRGKAIRCPIENRARV